MRIENTGDSMALRDVAKTDPAFSTIKAAFNAILQQGYGSADPALTHI